MPLQINNINNNICLTPTQISSANGRIIENIDGSVSVFMASTGKSSPVVLSEQCCSVLSPNYIFDENTQKCMWTKTPNCETNTSYKMILNPTNNDGAFFNISGNENCELNVEFDFLFKVSCKTLNDLTNKTGQISFVTSETKGLISKLENEIQDQQTISESLSNQIVQLQLQINDTPYSITCESNFINQISIPSIPSSTAQAYGNTGFNSEPTGTINLTGQEFTQKENNIGTFCLTEAGLNALQQILLTGYTSFINGDPNSYSCDDVNKLIEQNSTGNLILVIPCDVPFGTKTQLINNKSVIETQLVESNDKLSQLTNQYNELINNTPTLTTNCNEPINFFESLDVSMAIEVVSGSSLVTVYEGFDLFSAIGEGNLYDYLSTHVNSGFYVYDYVTGDPIILNDTNINSCNSTQSVIMSSLVSESGLDLSIQSNLDEFNSLISENALGSKWIHYSTTISDPDILTLLADKKIKLSLKVNNSCGDVCVLLDNIKLNKDCKRVSKTNIFVTQSPGFDLEKIRDNKKSWSTNTSIINRNFEILNSKGTNPIRETNYNCEDERLILNSKEIDLDINLASAIETDIWSYITENPCLLSGTSNCDQCLSGCCGDNLIDFNDILTQPLSAVTVVEDFEYYLSSELIDAKNRQTISSYPTLKALYDRYVSSSAYCGTNSSAFNYDSIDTFADLIGNYWVDIIEQVIPATTIWGSVKIYSNTIFDQQKYKYKAYTTLICNNPFSGETVPSPINGVSGDSQSVGVSYSVINGNLPTWLTFGNQNSGCNEISIAQMNFGSEFIGTVTELTSSSPQGKSNNVINLNSE